MRDFILLIYLIVLLSISFQSCNGHAKHTHLKSEFPTDFKKIEVPSNPPLQDSFPSGSFTTAFQDQVGFVWLGGEMGIYVFDGNEFTRIQIDEKYPTLTVSAIDQDDHGTIWIGTDRGIYWLNGTRFSPFKIPVSEGNLKFVNHLVKDTIVTDLHFDNDGNLWYGIYDGGLWRYNGKSFTQFQPVAGKWQITHQQELRDPSTKGYVQDIFQDKEKRIWISFRGDGPALSYFTSIGFQHVKTDHLKDSTLLSIAQDREGKIWMLSPGDGPLLVDDQNGLHLDALTHPQTESYGLIIDHENNLWMAGANEMQNKNSATRIYRLDHQTKKWIDTEITEGKGLIPLLADREGNLWLSGEGFALYLYNGKETINCISMN